MPGRIRWDDLHRNTRAKVTKLADRVARPAPARTRSARQPAPPEPRWLCLTCGLRSASEPAAARHADATRHYRYTDLGMVDYER